MTGNEVSPDALHEAFGLVANETRFDIVAALWEATTTGETPLSFSSLRERVGVRDSGQFNYHLDRLTPRFVRSVPDGYELTHAGKQLVGAAVSGTYTETDVAVAPTPVGDCPRCGSTLEAEYESGYMVVECTGCDVVITDGLAVPPVLVAGHEPEELPAVFARHLLTEVRRINGGFCPLCGGSMDQSLTRSGSPADDESGGTRPDVTCRCRACGNTTHMAVGTAVIDHSAVVAFLHDVGIDIRERPVWELDWLLDPHATVVGEDPVRVRVEIETDGAVLDLTLDGDLSVLEYDRR